MQRSTAAAVAAAERAGQSREGERAERLVGVEHELARITALRDRALAMAPDLRR